MASESGLVRRTIKVLRAVAAHPSGAGLSEVSRTAEIPKATCYRVLTVLESESWLRFDPDTRRYHVSLGLLSLVGGLLDADGAYGYMRRILAELAEATGETCGFDVLLPPNVMVVAQVAGHHLIGQTAKPVPRTQPVWSTSTGKVLLATLDRDQIRADYEAEFSSKAPAAAGSFDAFLDVLDEVKQRGYAYTSDELEKGATSLAVPVRDGDRCPYALWIGGPTFRLTSEWIEQSAPLLIDASRRLGEVLSVTQLRLPGSMAVSALS